MRQDLVGLLQRCSTVDDHMTVHMTACTRKTECRATLPILLSRFLDKPSHLVAIMTGGSSYVEKIRRLADNNGMDSW